MRLIAALSTLGCLALAALAGHQLWQVLAHPAPPHALQLQRSQSDPATPAPAPAPLRYWPPIFGEKQPPRPARAPSAQSAPQPPQPPKPPLESLGYVLKGRVQAGTGTWAIVDHPSGEQLLRRGDVLREGIEVVRIDAAGLWISRQGDAPELLGFAED